MTLLRLRIECTDRGHHTRARLGELGIDPSDNSIVVTLNSYREGPSQVDYDVDLDDVRQKVTMRCPRCRRDQQRRYAKMIEVATALCTTDERGWRTGRLDISHLP